MKKLILNIILLTIWVSLFSQYDKELEYLKHYGFGITQVNTGSGHGSGTSFNLNLQKGKKSLEVGAIYQNREGKIAGADFKYKVFAGKFDEDIYRIKFIRPYFQYNLIYHKATVNAPTVLELKSTQYEMPSETGTIATLEHYLSYGMQMKLYKSIFLDSSFGLGVYFGSLDKMNHPDTPGIHKDNYGFTGSFKIGIGYRIN